MIATPVLILSLLALVGPAQVAGQSTTESEKTCATCCRTNSCSRPQCRCPEVPAPCGYTCTQAVCVRAPCNVPITCRPAPCPTAPECEKCCPSQTCTSPKCNCPKEPGQCGVKCFQAMCNGITFPCNPPITCIPNNCEPTTTTTA